MPACCSFRCAPLSCWQEAFEESEKYKEKKFIVEKAKITKETLA